MTVGCPQGLAAGQILGQTLVDFAEVEELDFSAMTCDGMIDQLDDLVVADPAVGMEDQREDTPFDHRSINGRLEVLDGLRVADAMKILCIPVAGHQAGDLPAQPPDDVRIGIVLDQVGESTIGRHVLAEPLLAVVVEDQFPRQVGIVGREEHHHGRVDRQEIARGRGSVEDFGKEPRANRAHRVAAGHAKGHRPIAGNRPHRVDTQVECSFGRREIAALQARARMTPCVGFQIQAFLEPLPKPRMVRVDRMRHDTDRRPAVDLFEPVEDRPQERLILLDVPLVVDGQHDYGFDAFFADPLRRDQFGRLSADIIRIRRFVEIGQTVAVGSQCGSIQCQENHKRGKKSV